MKTIYTWKFEPILVSDCDFEYLDQYRWRIHKSARGSTPYARTRTKVDGKLVDIFMHRLIMKPTGKLLVDHMNRNGLDNRRENLRLCTNSENSMARKPLEGCVSKYKGVCYHKKSKNNPWRATIYKDRKRNNLGYFKTQEAAALAYNSAAIELFGDFAYLNVIKS